MWFTRSNRRSSNSRLTRLCLCIPLLVFNLVPQAGRLVNSARSWVYLRHDAPLASDERLIEIKAEEKAATKKPAAKRLVKNPAAKKPSVRRATGEMPARRKAAPKKR